MYIFIIDDHTIYRRHYRKVHPWTLQLCWKSPIYERSEHIGGQEQTYQELNLKKIQRQDATNT